MTKSYILNAEPGHLRIHGSDTQFTVSKISDAVDTENSIPPDIKTAVKDYLEELLKNITENTQEIILNLPSDLTQYSDIILEIIKGLMGA